MNQAASALKLPSIVASRSASTALHSFLETRLGEHGADEQAPQLGNPETLNLRWPTSVIYSGVWRSVRDPVDGAPATVVSTQSISEDANRPRASHNAPILPKIDAKDEIRLLRLQPGRLSDPIRADLESACLRSSSIPVYDALSYKWADETRGTTRDCPVFLGSYWDIVYVARGCEKALKRIRHRRTARLVWVDAVCIRFEDVNERNCQVALVREIYVKASKVVLYLGEAADDSAMALGLISEATSQFSVSCEATVPDERHQKALASLFTRPYFSRLWVMQEIALAREVEIVCGQDSVLCPKLPLDTILPECCGPSWFSDRFKWRESVSRKAPGELFLHASAYRCSDARDKVFGILALLNRPDLIPDYSLSTESIYTGIAAYLIKNQDAFDILAFATSGKRRYNTPSWVPDWSQKLEKRYPKTIDYVSTDFDMENAVLQSSNLVAFNGFRMGPSEGLHVDCHTGSLNVNALKLCELTGQRICYENQINILMDKGVSGALIVTVPDLTYELGKDHVFLLEGWSQPVILRSQPGADSYTLVSTCALAVGNMTGCCFLPWSDTANELESKIPVSKFSPEELTRILGFASTLLGLSGIESTAQEGPDVTLRVLDFGLLSMTKLWQIESRLKERWVGLEQQLGWMFLDQVAVGKLVDEFNQNDQLLQQCRGESDMGLEPHETIRFARYCGIKLETSIQWDLCQFCSAFLRIPMVQTAAFPDTWTPVLSQLKSQLPEIQQWAEVTEQLLRLIEYSDLVLGRSWPSTLGNEQPAKWHSCWKNVSSITHRGTGARFDPNAEIECTWSWSEFKSTLALRARLWEQTFPRQLSTSVNKKMAVHLGLRAIGVDVFAEYLISIT